MDSSDQAIAAERPVPAQEDSGSRRQGSRPIPRSNRHDPSVTWHRPTGALRNSDAHAACVHSGRVPALSCERTANPLRRRAPAREPSGSNAQKNRRAPPDRPTVTTAVWPDDRIRHQARRQIASAVATKLESVLGTLQRRAQQDDTAAIEHARRHEEWRRERDGRQEQQRRQRIEHARSQRLLAQTMAWRRVAETRGYLQALEQKPPLLLEAERGRVAAWIEWANGWAKRADPVENTQLIVGFDDRQDQFASLPSPWSRRS